MASTLERTVVEMREGTVTTVNLSQGSIDDVGATQLADALRTNTSLRNLDLHYNEIDDEGAVQLADALCTNTSVQELDLNSNAVSEELQGRIEALLKPAARAQRKAQAALKTTKG